jgi:uncharacterized protein YegJ (DUF2314 family)
MSNAISWIEGEDPQMLEAFARARATFRFFWREMTWEARRIVPGLEMAAVKLTFTEEVAPGLLGGLFGKKKAPQTKVEHMWVSDVEFDGTTLTGVLLNDPHELQSVRAGDSVSSGLDRLADWMYVIAPFVYGGFTVDVIRRGMSEADRAEHDAAWGLDFGSPGEVTLTPFDDDDAEHPMSANMAPKLGEAIDGDPSLLAPAADGSTLLHDMALGGSAASVEVLLAKGADPAVRRADGKTAADLAEAMGWSTLAQRLRLL